LTLLIDSLKHILFNIYYAHYFKFTFLFTSILLFDLFNFNKFILKDFLQIILLLILLFYPIKQLNLLEQVNLLLLYHYMLITFETMQYIIFISSKVEVDSFYLII